MTRPRLLVRKVGPWWHIFVGHGDYALPYHYTTNTDAHDAAQRLAAKENTWR